ncbi:MAG: hypothetical protein ABJF50_14045 [Paracoccaceae bacterium]
MKTLLIGLLVSLGVTASTAKAEQMLNVDGTVYPLSALMGTCQRITDDPAAQIACFNHITLLLDEQSGGAQQEKTVPVPQALEALRAVAQYQDDESGLLIAGSECRIQIVYFNNYYHISRRNISSLDLFSAQFDASDLEFDQTVKSQGGQAPLSKGVLANGATAVTRGGVELESAQLGFEPRSPRMSLEAYASEVVAQLPAREGQSFEFVLVHPQKSQASPEIWKAFQTFVKACDGALPF